MTRFTRLLPAVPSACQTKLAWLLHASRNAVMDHPDDVRANVRDCSDARRGWTGRGSLLCGIVRSAQCVCRSCRSSKVSFFPITCGRKTCACELALARPTGYSRMCFGASAKCRRDGGMPHHDVPGTNSSKI